MWNRQYAKYFPDIHAHLIYKLHCLNFFVGPEPRNFEFSRVVPGR